MMMMMMMMMGDDDCWDGFKMLVIDLGKNNETDLHVIIRNQNLPPPLNNILKWVIT